MTRSPGSFSPGPFLIGLAGIVPLWALALAMAPPEPHVAPAREREAWQAQAKAVVALPRPDKPLAAKPASSRPDVAFGSLNSAKPRRNPLMPQSGFAEIEIPRFEPPAPVAATIAALPAAPVPPVPQAETAATAVPPPLAETVTATPAPPPQAETLPVPAAASTALAAPAMAATAIEALAVEASVPPPAEAASSTTLPAIPAAPADAMVVAYAPQALGGTGDAAVFAPRMPAPPPDAAPAPAAIPPQTAPAAEAPLPDATEEIIAADTTGVRPGIALYARGDVTAADRLARNLTDPVARAALEYVALRTNFRVLGYERVMAFRAANPGWPGAAWLSRRGEELLYSGNAPAPKIKAHFEGRTPETPQGKLAIARLLLAGGERARAAELVREVWRGGDMPDWLERSLRDGFPNFLTEEDFKYRASYYLFKENTASGLRLAALAGPDYMAVAKARAAVINEDGGADALYQAVPPALRGDPGLIFSRVQHLRRAERLREAADMLLAAPRDPAVLVNGDEWWVERRLVARELLDANDAAGAYLVAQGHGATSSGSKVEAEFHAGWIALRFLNDASVARHHFAQAAAAAETSMSLSRAHYWLGRATEAAGNASEANDAFEKAASYGANYYGQLAQNRLGRANLSLREPAPAAQGDARDMSVRVIEMLYALGEKAHANALAYEAAQKLTDEPQLAALATVITRQKNAQLLLGIGKVVTQRGLGPDAMAFPTFGVPAYQPLENSAEKAMVYSIARQESAFQTDAQSKAGAKGLMQMLVSTAARTAGHKGVPFAAARLISDPAFNAQLGAAHLGELLEEQDGSYILTFAAYNAGGKRVSEWIAAYGDPRKPGVDPVDWVERIPITETRNYVQRIIENMQVYRYRLGDQTTLLIDADLRRTR